MVYSRITLYSSCLGIRYDHMLFDSFFDDSFVYLPYIAC